MMAYTKEQIETANAHPALGANYEAVGDFVEKFLEHWKDDHAEKLAVDVVKPLVDEIHNRAIDALKEWILADTTDNVSQAMRGMVDDSVSALIGGQVWANKKYITPKTFDGQKVRETLARLYSDDIKSMRIEELEREVARLSDALSARNGAY